MKKLLALALISLFVVGVVYAGSPTLPYAGDVMGMKCGRMQYDPHRTFRLVHCGDNNTLGGAALAAGYVVIWDTTFDDGVSVTTTTTSSDSRTAGILATAISSGDTSATLCNYTASEDVGVTSRWGWLQVFGPSVSDPTIQLPTGISVSAGDAMGAASTAGLATEMITGVTAGWSATGQGNLGFAMDDGTTATTCQVFITIE